MPAVKDIMTTDVITVNSQTSIYDAIKILVENNITGLPVVDDNMKLVGIITEKDVLKLVYNVEDRPSKVEDFMTEDVISFDQEETLTNICDAFIKNHFRRVPIVSKGKLIGIISRKDIIKYILKPTE